MTDSRLAFALFCYPRGSMYLPAMVRWLSTFLPSFFHPLCHCHHFLKFTLFSTLPAHPASWSNKVSIPKQILFLHTLHCSVSTNSLSVSSPALLCSYNKSSVSTLELVLDFHWPTYIYRWKSRYSPWTRRRRCFICIARTKLENCTRHWNISSTTSVGYLARNGMDALVERLSTLTVFYCKFHFNVRQWETYEPVRSDLVVEGTTFSIGAIFGYNQYLGILRYSQSTGIAEFVHRRSAERVVRRVPGSVLVDSAPAVGIQYVSDWYVFSLVRECEVIKICRFSP